MKNEIDKRNIKQIIDREFENPDQIKQQLMAAYLRYVKKVFAEGPFFFTIPCPPKKGFNHFNPNPSVAVLNSLHEILGLESVDIERQYA